MGMCALTSSGATSNAARYTAAAAGMPDAPLPSTAAMVAPPTAGRSSSKNAAQLTRAAVAVLRFPPELLSRVDSMSW